MSIFFSTCSNSRSVVEAWGSFGRWTMKYSMQEWYPTTPMKHEWSLADVRIPYFWVLCDKVLRSKTQDSLRGTRRSSVSYRADKAAKDAAANGRSQTAGWSSLTHIHRKINEAQKSEIQSWHKTRNEERERRHRSYYTPRLKPGIDSVLGKAPKKYASRFFQLKVGHGAVGLFSERIGVVETAECWWSRQAEQSVIHLYVNRRKWIKERRVLKRKLQQLGIGWQRPTEKRWLANLLANEQAVTPLLKYLMTTEVGTRGGEADREAEWERRGDQAGEEQLDR